MMSHLADLQLTYSPEWGANGQGDQKLYDFVTELIDEFSGWDVTDTNIGDTISRQQAIEEAKEWIEAVYCDHDEIRERMAIKHVINGIKELPPAGPQIIRCRECKEFRKWVGVDITFCDRTESQVSEDEVRSVHKA